MNWKNITTDLLASGLTQTEIANALGVSQFWVHMLASGKRVREPTWTHGNALIALHRERCNG
jgi:predicted transcriptional regulator